MALYTVTTGSTILAADIDQLVYVLQRQSGQTESGKYHYIGNSYTFGSYLGAYINSKSAVSTPVSVSVDTSIEQTGAGSIGTGDLSSAGFSVAWTYLQGTRASTGGNYTIQY